MFSLLCAITLLLFGGCTTFARPISTNNILSRRNFSGKATYFFQDGNPGACNSVHSDQDHIIAIPTPMYANGAHCGKTITLTDTKTGKTAIATVADECPGCDGGGSIDLSKGLFEVFANTNDGVFPVSWHFN